MLYKIAEKIYELEAQGKKITRMNVGEPIWPTPKEVIEEAVYEIKNKPIRYGSSAGAKDFRIRLAQIHKTTEKNIVVEPGSKFGIFSLMHILLKGNKKAMLFSPHWTAYERMAKEVGGKLSKIELNIENDWSIDINEVNEKCDKETKLIVVNNPFNPTSNVWDVKTERAIKEIAKDNNAYVLFDDAYRALKFEGEHRERVFEENETNEIIAMSFSKSLMMSGWRLGYVVAPEYIIEKLIKLNQITITNTPEFIQHGAMNALPRREEIAKELREKNKESADVAFKMLNEFDFKVVKPKAGFYIFPKLGVDGLKVTEKLLEYGYAIVPGAAFGNYKEYVRISLCHPTEVVEDAMNKLKDVVDSV